METKDILRDYVGDMVAVQNHCLESIKRQIVDDKFKRFPEAHDVLAKVENILNAQQLTLDRCLDALDGGVGAAIKKAASTAAGAISGLYGKLRPEDPVSRSLRDDYVALNLLAVSYTMLHTTALALNNAPVADMAIKHLNQITPFIVELNRIIPLVVATELSDENKIIDPSIWKKAQENSQKAWSHFIVGEYH